MAEDSGGHADTSARDRSAAGALSHQPSGSSGWRRRHHDLRQPLNALGLFCAALRARPLGPAEHPLVQGIADAAAALEAMIDTWAAEEAAREGAGPHPVGAHEARTPGTADSPVDGPEALPLILVIDDDPGSRLSTAVLLESWGARVTELDSVAALQAWLAMEGPHARPRLALVDFHLGATGTGLQALRSLRAAYPADSVPAVLISGDESAWVAAREHEDLVMLRKPVDPQSLLDTVARQLRA